MELNSIVFPSPDFQGVPAFLKDSLVWIPCYKESQSAPGTSKEEKTTSSKASFFCNYTVNSKEEKKIEGTFLGGEFEEGKMNKNKIPDFKSPKSSFYEKNKAASLGNEESARKAMREENKRKSPDQRESASVLKHPTAQEAGQNGLDQKKKTPEESWGMAVVNIKRDSESLERQKSQANNPAQVGSNQKNSLFEGDSSLYFHNNSKKNESISSRPSISKRIRVSSTLSETQISHFIPGLLLKPTRPCDTIVVYFHGNAEHIFNCYEIAQTLCKHLNLYILVPEFPGYSVYNETKPNEQLVCSNSEAIIDFLHLNMKFRKSKIIVIGRSIGGGVACHVAKKRKVGCLILVSAFTSIKATVTHLAGVVGKIFKERFENIEVIKEVSCPTLIIHGGRDQVIPSSHAEALFDACPMYTELVISPKMTHSTFNFINDFINPIIGFLIVIGFNKKTREMANIEFQKALYRIPSHLSGQLKLI